MSSQINCQSHEKPERDWMENGRECFSIECRAMSVSVSALGLGLGLGRSNPLCRGRYAMWQTDRERERAKFRGCFSYAARKIEMEMGNGET